MNPSLMPFSPFSFPQRPQADCSHLEGRAPALHRPPTEPSAPLQTHKLFLPLYPSISIPTRSNRNLFRRRPLLREFSLPSALLRDEYGRVLTILLFSRTILLLYDSSPDSSALSLLASQPSHYISALLLGRRYLLTPNDVLTIPKMKGVSPGDRIALTRILEVGSRDYTLRASAPPLDPSSNPLPVPATARDLLTTSTIPRDWQRHPDSLPYLSEDVVRAELTVLEHTKGKEFEVEKFKRRKGYRRKLRSKLGFTRLRVGEILLGNGN